MPKLPPILYHYFKNPLPYARTLQLQESIHRLQLHQRSSASSNSPSHPDILLLLQHRPVYTGGRRQSEESLSDERRALTSLGADFEVTNRGGQLTYHGPGQIVGYPMIDLSRPLEGSHEPMRTREYVCRLEKIIKSHLLEKHGIPTIQSEHTGIFLDKYTKVGSIGIQVRHYLTNHGFAFNVTNEPLGWFDRIVACGLDGVRAGSIHSWKAKNDPGKSDNVKVEDEIERLVERFGRGLEREIHALDLNAGDDDLAVMVKSLDIESRTLGPWNTVPVEPIE